MAKNAREGSYGMSYVRVEGLVKRFGEEVLAVDSISFVVGKGWTAVYVTHDQAEALVMSDEIIVMDQGRIQQKGDARTIYMRPANRFVANFISVANLLEWHFVAKSEDENRGDCLMKG